MQSYYVDSRARVRVGMDVSGWFLVNVELKQGCVSDVSMVLRGILMLWYER